MNPRLQYLLSRYDELVVMTLDALKMSETMPIGKFAEYACSNILDLVGIADEMKAITAEIKQLHLLENINE